MATTGINVKKVAFDTALVLSVGLVVLALRSFGSPRRQGFFCHDESIRYPKLPDTISDSLVAVATLLFPMLTIIGTEAVVTGRGAPSGLSWRGAPLPLWLLRAYRQAGVFILGAGLTEVTVDVAKYYVGRLRPNFLAACNPVGMDSSSFTKLCSAASPGNPVYVAPSLYRCLGDPEDEREARVSFPSAHSVLAFYAAVYLALYVQARGPRVAGGCGGGLVRLLLQWLLLLAAWWTALSRVVDNVHHPADVMVGASIGTLCAALQVFVVSGIFSEQDDTGADPLVVLIPSKTYSAPNCV